MGRRRTKNKWKMLYLYPPPSLREYVLTRAREEKKTVTQLAVELLLESPSIPDEIRQVAEKEGFVYGKTRTLTQDYMVNMAQEARKRVLEYVKEHGVATVTQLQEAATVKSTSRKDKLIGERTVRKYVNHLEEQGLVEKEYKGRGGKLYVHITEGKEHEHDG